MGVEPKPYGPDSSEVERRALLDRISVHADRVILFREIPAPTLFSADLLFDRVAELAACWDSWALLTDLQQGGRPDASVRARITERMRALKGLERVVVVTGGRVLMTVAVKFMFPQIPGVHRVICGTMDEALRVIAEGSSP